jgi:hypothetical protein
LKNRRAQIIERFSECADAIVDAAKEGVLRRLHSITSDAFPGLNPTELSECASFSFDDDDVQKMSPMVASLFEQSLSGLPVLYEKTHRALSEAAIRTVIPPYRRATSGDPEQYFRSKYEPLFELLELPLHALVSVDGNLTNYLPRVADRKEAFRSVGKKRRTLADRELGLGEKNASSAPAAPGTASRKSTRRRMSYVEIMYSHSHNEP